MKTIGLISGMSWESSHIFFLTAFQSAMTPSGEIVIAGRAGSQGVRSMVEAVHREFLPDTVLVFRPENGEAGEIEDLAPLTRDRHAIDGMPAAYICENFACHEPATDVGKLISVIRGDDHA